MNLSKLFLNHCEDKQYEINQNQIDTIDKLKDYYLSNFNQNFLKKFFKKKKSKLGFYLVGDVGVGKTMILNFFFKTLKEKKLRLHFNEFMIKFHNHIFENKDKENGIKNFVRDLNKKTEILYFDEFQVTNIVDAMILGRLFEEIFEENIKVIFSSNILIKDLYKDGLQRDQFKPFIEIMKKRTIEHELLIEDDYRKSKDNQNDRYFFPLNEETNFKMNKYFRMVSKGKKKKNKILNIKGRDFQIKEFYEGIVRFNFNELCNQNLGAEDYLEMIKVSEFIFIDKIPQFDDINSNEQQRFITLIDIVYEKKIPIAVSAKKKLNELNSSKLLKEPFKRTISRLYELTSSNFNL